MRNHSKIEKDRIKTSRADNGRVKNQKELNATTITTTTSTSLKKQKHKTFALPVQECIYHDIGSKKSYIDLSESRREAESYSRISVIQSVAAQTSPATECCRSDIDYFQEKPVDFSPKNKFKTEYSTNDSNNMIDIPRQYAAMVV